MISTFLFGSAHKLFLPQRFAKAEKPNLKQSRIDCAGEADSVWGAFAGKTGERVLSPARLLPAGSQLLKLVRVPATALKSAHKWQPARTGNERLRADLRETERERASARANELA